MRKISFCTVPYIACGGLHYYFLNFPEHSGLRPDIRAVLLYVENHFYLVLENLKHLWGKFGETISMNTTLNPSVNSNSWNFSSHRYFQMKALFLKTVFSFELWKGSKLVQIKTSTCDSYIEQSFLCRKPNRKWAIPSLVRLQKSLLRYILQHDPQKWLKWLTV